MEEEEEEEKEAEEDHRAEEGRCDVRYIVLRKFGGQRESSVSLALSPPCRSPAKEKKPVPVRSGRPMRLVFFHFDPRSSVSPAKYATLRKATFSISDGDSCYFAILLARCTARARARSCRAVPHF